MRTKSKALLLVLCSVALIVAATVGTLGYLTDSEAVTNTFTVGQVSITLDEAKVGDDGKAITGEDAARVAANKYKLIPGYSYDKDPTVTVKAGSEESYIRMVVTVNKKAALDAIGVDIQTVFTGYDTSKWGTPIESNANDTRTYEFRYYQTVAAPTEDVKLESLFTGMTIPGAITAEQLKTLKDLKIEIVAHAIQAAGFTDANAAWTAFGEQAGATTGTTGTGSETGN